MHRLVARALLYSSVSPDTRVYASLARPEVTIDSIFTMMIVIIILVLSTTPSSSLWSGWRGWRGLTSP